MAELHAKTQIGFRKEEGSSQRYGLFSIFFSKLCLLLFLSMCISAFSMSPNHLPFLPFSVNSFAAHFLFFLLSLSPHYFVIPGKSHLSVLSLLTPFNFFLRLPSLFSPSLYFVTFVSADTA